MYIYFFNWRHPIFFRLKWHGTGLVRWDERAKRRKAAGCLTLLWKMSMMSHLLQWFTIIYIYIYTYSQMAIFHGELLNYQKGLSENIKASQIHLDCHHFPHSNSHNWVVSPFSLGHLRFSQIVGPLYRRLLPGGWVGCKGGIRYGVNPCESMGGWEMSGFFRITQQIVSNSLPNFGAMSHPPGDVNKWDNIFIGDEIKSTVECLNFKDQSSIGDYILLYLYIYTQSPRKNWRWLM